MVLNSALCKVTLQLEVIHSFLFPLNGGLVLQSEKESIDADDLFKEKALRLWNEKHDCILLQRTHYFCTTQKAEGRNYGCNSFCAHKRN